MRRSRTKGTKPPTVKLPPEIAAEFLRALGHALATDMKGCAALVDAHLQIREQLRKGAERIEVTGDLDCLWLVANVRCPDAAPFFRKVLQPKESGLDRMEREGLVKEAVQNARACIADGSIDAPGLGSVVEETSPQREFCFEGVR